jgi:putative endopeptidase
VRVTIAQAFDAKRVDRYGTVMLMKPMTLIAAVTVMLGCATSRPGPGERRPRASTNAGNTTAITTSTAMLASGIDTNDFERSVRPQDDLYEYVNGAWLKRTPIPDDRVRIGTFVEVDERTLALLQAILESREPPLDPGEQKLRDLYASYMNESRVEALGARPLEPTFARIDAVRDRRELASLLGALLREGIAVPFRFRVHQDIRDARRYILDVEQSGLSVDAGYYRSDDDPHLKEVRALHRTVQRSLALAGDKYADANASAIVGFEMDLAKLHWTELQRRDPKAGYNVVRLSKVRELAPGLEWSDVFEASGVAGRTDVVNVSQPSFLTGCAKLLASAPLPTLKAYLKWHALLARAPELSDKFADAQVVAYRGERPARWKRALHAIQSAMGEQLGKSYVEKHFSLEAKQRILTLVHTLLDTFDDGIDRLDWMGPATKREAKAKLFKIAVKVGYPDRFRDYSGLAVVRDDLFGNMVRADVFEFERNLAKLGAPIDRNEWNISPQQLDAYYNPERNEIVFPAAVLQPPLFDPHVDEATNYGAIGAMIGHEISHAFDDRGSQYDGDGNLRNWWTDEDHAQYVAKTKALIYQYSAFEAVPGYHLNGELTLGENIADNSGLAIAYRAYHRALGPKPAKTMDGLTGDQRLFLSFARMWRSKQREGYAIARVKADPHADEPHRVLGSVVNQPGFHEAFDLKAGDKLYVAPERRIIIW